MIEVLSENCDENAYPAGGKSTYPEVGQKCEALKRNPGRLIPKGFDQIWFRSDFFIETYRLLVSISVE